MWPFSPLRRRGGRATEAELERSVGRRETAVARALRAAEHVKRRLEESDAVILGTAAAARGLFRRDGGDDRE